MRTLNKAVKESFTGKVTLEKTLNGVISGGELFKERRKIKTKCPQAEAKLNLGFSDMALIGNLDKSNFGGLIGVS